ncbi:MAG: hypothetical protein ACJ72O_16735 [Marmoricola sp.]
MTEQDAGVDPEDTRMRDETSPDADPEPEGALPEEKVGPAADRLGTTNTGQPH